MRRILDVVRDSLANTEVQIKEVARCGTDYVVDCEYVYSSSAQLGIPCIILSAHYLEV